MTEREIALELSGVTKMYGDFTAVDDVSLVVPKGSIYGFLGPNGAGKTTTIRMILDIVRPTRGKLTILGRPSALEVRERIGYLPEEKGLYKKMKAVATVAYFASLKGIGRKQAKKRAYELLERYGLKDFAEAKTEALSKGMQQKVQVLASIAHDPEFVVLDEPFSGLDPVNQEVMEEVIRDMSAAGATILFSTHVMSHAERICDRILLIAKGRKIFDGTIAEAKAVMPRRVLVEGGAELATLGQLEAVSSARQPDPEAPDLWEFKLRDGHDPQDLLQACFERQIRLRRFDRRDPDLHEVFVHLVGPEAKEATHR
ncbi:MAG: ATP-binding cassette domain-containing protein [Planctomycetes bacterium]|nr:ATP-binding cassette domain-containing protein [Planctomycetota bacterium]